MVESWNEIIEAQKVRSDLLKWKIIAVATLGAAGLGFSNQNMTHADLVLCCIPLVCAYIDSLCRHLSIRIALISQIWTQLKSESTDTGIMFLRSHQIYVQNALKDRILSLEDYVVVISSSIFSLALIIIGLPNLGAVPHGLYVAVSGVLGLVLTIIVEIIYRRLKSKVSDSAKRTTEILSGSEGGAA